MLLCCPPAARCGRSELLQAQGQAGQTIKGHTRQTITGDAGHDTGTDDHAFSVDCPFKVIVVST